MKVELLLADDSELRNAVKDLIKAEVVSIARSEIRSIIAGLVDEKLMPKSQTDIEKIVYATIVSEVQAQMKDLGGFWNDKIKLKEAIKLEISEQVRVALKEIITQK